MVAPTQRLEIHEVVDPGGGLILELRANGVRVATARATADMIHDLGVAQGMSRSEIRAGLERSLSDLRLAPELDRQLFGYWFGPGEDIPRAPIGWPTGAVLPRSGQGVELDDFICLDLVPVNNYWLVLSERGRYTYRHTAGLLNGEAWRFVPVKEPAGSWPVVFDANFAPPLGPHAIESHFGFEAASRSRPDAPAVQLRLVRRT